MAVLRKGESVDKSRTGGDCSYMSARRPEEDLLLSLLFSIEPIRAGCACVIFPAASSEFALESQLYLHSYRIRSSFGPQCDIFPIGEGDLY